MYLTVPTSPGRTFAVPEHAPAYQQLPARGATPVHRAHVYAPSSPSQDERREAWLASPTSDGEAYPQNSETSSTIPGHQDKRSPQWEHKSAHWEHYGVRDKAGGMKHISPGRLPLPASTRQRAENRRTVPGAYNTCII